MSEYMNQPDDGALLAKEYGMLGMEPERDLEIIEGEIHFYIRQGITAAIEIGERLIEAKAQLKHGEWLPWLREKIGIPERSASRFMQLARECPKSAKLADLGVSKALALLALPVSEREDFVAEKHEVGGVEKSVADMTAKELKKAIEERDNARKTLEAMKARAEVAEQSREKMEKDMRQLKEMSKRAKEAEEQKSVALAAAEKELEELRSRPVDVAVQVQDASPEQLAEAKAAGAAEADQKHKEMLTAKEDDIRKLKEDLRKAREEAKAANINLQTAEREVRAAKDEADKANKMARVLNNENMMKFTVLFEQAKKAVNQMAKVVEKESQENQAKMKAALNALAQAIEEVACA